MTYVQKFPKPGPSNKMIKRTKYNVARNTKKLYGFDSLAERDRHTELTIFQAAGKISDLKRQTRVELEQDIFYRTDFDYVSNGIRVYEDVKGVETERFRLIKKIWRLHGPGELLIVKRAGRSFEITGRIHSLKRVTQ